MNKKIIVSIIIVFALLLIVGGVFWWQRKRISEVGLISTKEFSISQIGEEKIIENKKAKLQLKLPIDWQVIDGLDSFVFISPDFQIHPNVGPYSPPIPEKGCSITLRVKQEIESSEYDIEYSFLREEIKTWFEAQKYYDGEIINMNGEKALKTYTYLLEEQSVFGAGTYVLVRLPKNEKVYKFETYLFSQDRERCAQEFNRFLETVSIE